MDVEGVTKGEIMDRPGDDLPVGDDDVDVGGGRPDPLERGFVRSDADRLDDREAPFQGEGFDRRGRQAATASGRPVGLGDDELDRMARVEQSAKGGESGGRAPEEDGPHGCLAAAAFFLSFFLISVRFRAESFSTKRMPSRWSISWQKARANRSSPSISTGRPSRSRPRTTTR